MNSVQKKLEHLEKLKKDISAKLDKYEFNFNKEQDKLNIMDLNNNNKDGENNKSNNNIISGENYKEIMNKRLDDIMGKIDDHIINQNYTNLYKFLSNASPYKKHKQEKIIPNKEIKEEIKEIKQNESINISENIPSNNNNNNKSENEIKSDYNGTGKTDLEELKSKQNKELLQKQQNIYLSNELITLKNKLNNLRKDNEFLKSVINEKGMVKNTNVLEKFIGKFVERLSLNWDEIVEKIIDEMLIDEAYLLNEIDLKKINYEKNKNILIKNLIKAGFGGIIPENEENPSTNMDLIFDNIDFIQKVLNNVKQNEKDMKIKYNIK